MERSHFYHAVAPDRVLRESSLPQRHALDVHLDGRVCERDMHRSGPWLRGGDRRHKWNSEIFHPIPSKSKVSRWIIASIFASGMRGKWVPSTIWFTLRSASMVDVGVVKG